MWCEENEMNFTVMKWRRAQRGSRWFIPHSKYVCVSWLILKRWDSDLKKPVQFAHQFQAAKRIICELIFLCRAGCFHVCSCSFSVVHSR